MADMQYNTDNIETLHTNIAWGFMEYIVHVNYVPYHVNVISISSRITVFDYLPLNCNSVTMWRIAIGAKTMLYNLPPLIVAACISAISIKRFCLNLKVYLQWEMPRKQYMYGTQFYSVSFQMSGTYSAFTRDGITYSIYIN
jgi:hypothetical protein